MDDSLIYRSPFPRDISVVACVCESLLLLLVVVIEDALTGVVLVDDACKGLGVVSGASCGLWFFFFSRRRSSATMDASKSCNAAWPLTDPLIWWLAIKLQYFRNNKAQRSFYCIRQNGSLWSIVYCSSFNGRLCLLHQCEQ